MMEKTKLISILTDINAKLDDIDNYEEIVELLTSMKIINLCNYYIHIDQYDDDDNTIIGLIIQIMQAIYNNSDILPPISDELYDGLYEVYSTGNSDIIGAKNISNGKTVVHHKYPDLRGTLHKTHFLTEADRGKDKKKSLESWVKSINSTIGHKMSASEADVLLFPKFDGLSVVFECDANGNVVKALTRGDVDANEAIDVSLIFSGVRFRPIYGWTSEFGVKTEVIMKTQEFEEFNENEKPVKSRRSAVSSIINTLNPNIELRKYLTIVPLRAQNYETKEVRIHPEAYGYPYLQFTMNRLNEMGRFFDIIHEKMEAMSIPTDGIVLVLTHKDVCQKLGRVNHINEYEMAYKFPREQKRTTLLSIDYAVGTLGNIAPIARVIPVKMKGNMISNISLGSVERAASLKLRVGDEVIIKYEIIPYLDIDDTCKRSSNPVIEPPTHCSYCGAELVRNPLLRCDNNACPSRVMGSIVNYTDKMSIPEISEGTVMTLFRSGILMSIEDLYHLKDFKDTIVEIPGFGKKSYNKMIDAIDSRRSVFDYELLGSLGIPTIGQRIFKKILNIYYLSELIEICKANDIKKLTHIHGVESKTADKIMTGIQQNEKLIMFLTKELEVKHDTREYKAKVLFSSVKNAGDFKKYLETIGVLVMSSYSNEIDFLVVPDKDTVSEKTKKAIKAGKKILTLDEAETYFNYKKGE